MSTHYFWALALPKSTKQTMHSQLGDVVEHFPFKRWVYWEDYHITFAFLGSAEEQKLRRSIELVGEAIENERTFLLNLQGLGVFGSKKSPRIFWASVKKNDKLMNLQSLVFKACLRSGFTLESRPFAPHITLARNWTGDDFDHNWLDTYNPYQEKLISFPANEVVLYKTNLEKIPKYEPIATFSLISE
ncbi:RNA 2',3'-cyclic phosphodiesterase [Niallia oryzisoli]|uniref:RNA 2',3'-cyclic phosphodiesterase n=1 Tax=Niallia oryzisoli TaxID=1737571 RepID=A0ABZ2CEF9_9BACI